MASTTWPGSVAQRPASMHEVVDRPAGRGPADEGLRPERHPAARYRRLSLRGRGRRPPSPRRRAPSGRGSLPLTFGVDRGGDVGAALARERVVERSLRVDDERERDDRGGRRDQHDERDRQPSAAAAGRSRLARHEKSRRCSSRDLVQAALGGGRRCGRPRVRSSGSRSGPRDRGCASRARASGPSWCRPEEQRSDLLAGRAVERAGRLVREQQRGPVHERTGDRDPLALAAREPRGICVPMRGEPAASRAARRHERDPRAARIPPSWAGSSTLSTTVRSSRRLKNWKIIPTRFRRKRAAPVSPAWSIRVPATVTPPLVGRSRPGDQVQQRRLAAARRAHDRDGLAGGDLEADPVERRPAAARRSAWSPRRTE